ncbi:SDR family NAD(P)-dependent oxidoreductase [Psychrobium sp. 1_MG-2023]|uniref:SDR family NAD(P)-dependent oxidoreductase n=1 Tax=Psychrobium sp. 1_MG-2023 TaxID=3062624 RepID=UPI000C331E4E|nr:SDR family NAD(P)-dependent oxidoreductase [Psychrobium sp. 1_MG-2023]MDP2562154.1 SDR family NAD(P)-dependent oxidoreductase [Psychrobium sp. 1_MG-2023]PKF57174.1 short-chain dehydrogenase [Alteromonadales bacterium alter-6D02]
MADNMVLITGATSGIGAALVDEYLAKSDKVIACGRSQQKMAALDTRVYQQCLFDITDSDAVAQVASEVATLDILILNAGDCRYIDDVIKFDHQAFSAIIATNLTALGTLLAAFLPKVKRGGQVVFVSSSATILPFPRSEAYGASKAGADYLANSLRLDLLEHDIGVTLVHPGFVSTPLTDKNTFDMPFMITSQEAAKRIVKGVNQRKAYLHFPKRLTWLLKFFSILPAGLWQKLIIRNNP